MNSLQYTVRNRLRTAANPEGDSASRVVRVDSERLANEAITSNACRMHPKGCLLCGEQSSLSCAQVNSVAVTPLLTRVITPDTWERDYAPDYPDILDSSTTETGLYLARLEAQQHMRHSQVGKRAIRLARRMHGVRVFRSSVTKAIVECLSAGEVVRPKTSFTTHTKIINRSVAEELFTKRTLGLPDMREACVLQNELNALDQQSPEAYELRGDIAELDRRAGTLRDDIQAKLQIGAMWGFITETHRI